VGSLDLHACAFLALTVLVALEPGGGDSRLDGKKRERATELFGDALIDPIRSK
jgi:hypothetical protein